MKKKEEDVWGTYMVLLSKHEFRLFMVGLALWGLLKEISTEPRNVSSASLAG